MENQFKILASRSGRGQLRRGELITNHGSVQTPAIIPFAKRGAVSPLTMNELVSLECQGLVVPALPFFIQPGEKTMQKLGSLQTLMDWSRPLMSLVAEFAPMQKVKKNAGELGVRYEEPFTHAHKRLTSYQANRFQILGKADIQFPIYQVPDYYAPVDDLKTAVELNITWQKQVNSEWGVVVGAGLRALRSYCITELGDKCGYLIANLPDEPDEWGRIVKETCELLPNDRPRMIIASDSWQIFAALRLGVDIVITSLPMEAAHRGELYTATGTCRIGHEKYQDDSRLITVHAATQVTYAYLHYLNHQRDPLDDHYLGLSNLWWINSFAKQLRDAIQVADSAKIHDLWRIAEDYTAD